MGECEIERERETKAKSYILSSVCGSSCVLCLLVSERRVNLNARGKKDCSSKSKTQ